MPSGPLAATLRDAQALFSAGTAAGVDDDELLRRFLARRDVAAEVAFAAIVARHGPLVLAACRRALVDEHEAEDAFQATFLVLARRASSVRGSTLGPWLYGVARRIARRARADAQRRWFGRGLDVTGLRLVAAPGEEAASVAERAELGAVVDEELARLSGRDRAPLILCDLAGLTHEEAAERLGCPVGTVKSRQARARGRLRDRLARRGLAPAVALGLWESAVSARAAPSSRLVRSTVEGSHWFAVRGLAPPAGAVPVGVVATAESLLKGTIMMKLKLAGVAAALGVSAALGLAAVRGQDSPPLLGETVQPTDNYRSYDHLPPRANPAPETDRPDRMSALEDKLDRLLRVLERSSAAPTGPTSFEPPRAGAGRREPATSDPFSRNPATSRVETPPINPTNRHVSELTDSKRLDSIERRLSVLEQRVEFLLSRPQRPSTLDAAPAGPRTSNGGALPSLPDSNFIPAETTIRIP